MHLLHAGHVLCRHDRSLPRLAAANNAVDVDDSIANGNLQARWRPGRGADRPSDTVANMVIISSGIGYLLSHAGHRLQQVGSGDDAYKGVAAHNREPMNTVFFHKVDELVEVRTFRDSDGVAGHY